MGFRIPKVHHNSTICLNTISHNCYLVDIYLTIHIYVQVN